MFKQDKYMKEFNESDFRFMVHNSSFGATRYNEISRLIEQNPGIGKTYRDTNSTKKEYLRRELEVTQRLIELYRDGKFSEDDMQYMRQCTPFSELLYSHLIYFGDLVKKYSSREQSVKLQQEIKQISVLGSCLNGEYHQESNYYTSEPDKYQTEAIYDMKTHNFVLNTKGIYLYSKQFHILGTHCVVFCRVYAMQRYVGIHPFVIQLRHLSTRELLQGIQIKWLGTSLSLSFSSNYLVSLHNYQAPGSSMLTRFFNRENLLSYDIKQFNQVYIHYQLNQYMYMLVYICRQYLRACAITYMYVSQRKQFKDDEGNEVNVIEYQQVKDKILEVFTQAFALNNLANTFQEQIVRTSESAVDIEEKFNLVLISLEYISHTGIVLVEDLRQLTGGFGYLFLSSLPDIISNLQEITAFLSPFDKRISSYKEKLLQSSYQEKSLTIQNLTQGKLAQRPASTFIQEPERSLNYIPYLFQHMANVISEYADIIRNSANKNDFGQISIHSHLFIELATHFNLVGLVVYFTVYRFNQQFLEDLITYFAYIFLSKQSTLSLKVIGGQPEQVYAILNAEILRRKHNLDLILPSIMRNLPITPYDQLLFDQTNQTLSAKLLDVFRNHNPKNELGIQFVQNKKNLNQIPKL